MAPPNQHSVDPSTEKSQEDTLAKDGDLILVSGWPPARKTKIRLSAAFLSRMSPVFGNMLSGPFAEGQAKRSSAEPQELKLPGDDPIAVQDMCRLLYHQVQSLTKSVLAADRLFRLVKVVDKYDLMDVLRLQIRALMQAHFEAIAEYTLKESALRVGAAYLFGEKRFFNLATRDLISRFNSPLSSLLKLEGGELLPAIALLEMTEKRTRAQKLIIEKLTAVDDLQYDCGWNCDKDEYWEALEDAFDLEDWPPTFGDGEDAVQDMLQTMWRLDSLNVSHGCAHGCELVAMSESDLMVIADKVEKVCEGLCPRCVKEDRLGEDGVCLH